MAKQAKHEVNNKHGHLLLILAEKIDAGPAAKGQARGEEPRTQVNPKLLHLFRASQHLRLGSL